MESLAFYSALGEEFCNVLTDVVGEEICPQDGYEIFLKVLGKDFGPGALQMLTDSEIEQLRAFGCTWLECTNITGDHLREIVRRTLWRCRPPS